MPISFVPISAATSFLAYLNYLEDLADVVSGLYGQGVAGVYQSLQLHPPLRQLARRDLAGQQMQRLHRHLDSVWTTLSAIDNAVDPDRFDRQANAVVPTLAIQAVAAGASGLAVALGTDEPAGPEEALAFLGDFAAEELLPYPWSAFCVGCPQTGSAVWGGSVLPGDPVSIFRPPSAQTSDARLATLLRTTRQRILERRFAVERQTDVKPGRSRRNLTQEHKEAIAAVTAPTTVFDVLERIRVRVEDDDGETFVTAPLDEDEALRFAAALAAVVDASAAAVEGVIAAVIGWEVFADLAASHRRRTDGSTASSRRAAVLQGT
ncbi:MAG: hypothetical protein GEU74_09190 [Nitriliruptorales bacterium]|nr:hypothetical protein [Nitriliruptorales bacterium]